MKERRKARINEVIRRLVSDSIIQNVKDPRVGFVTVTKAEIADDMREARVFVSVMGTDVEKRKSILALNHMKGFFQKDLGPALQTRLTPVLSFELDDSAEQYSKMNELIDIARSSDEDK